MGLWWIFYYAFYTPKTKSEVVQSYCRLNGMKFKNLALSKFEPGDFDGNAKLREH